MTDQQIDKMFREYLNIKTLADDTTARANQIKAELNQAVEALGQVDDRGHVWLELSEEIGGYYSLQRQKRISKSLDEQVAEKILAERQLTDLCYKTIQVLDEDAIMAMLYEGRLTDEDIDVMFPSKVTWAFVPSKK